MASRDAALMPALPAAAITVPGVGGGPPRPAAKSIGNAAASLPNSRASIPAPLLFVVRDEVVHRTISGVAACASACYAADGHTAENSLQRFSRRGPCPV